VSHHPGHARGGQGGKVAPDLTHLASRRTIAAATLPNTPGHLAGWIVAPQHLKPGNYMPASDLDPGALQDLLAYLMSLQYATRYPMAQVSETTPAAAPDDREYQALEQTWRSPAGV
jgi:hypothetical protein